MHNRCIKLVLFEAKVAKAAQSPMTDTIHLHVNVILQEAST